MGAPAQGVGRVGGQPGRVLTTGHSPGQPARADASRAAAPRIVVLGTGSIGMRHVQVLKGLGADVTAVPVREERISELAAQGIDASRLVDALDRAPLGAVVATETGRHETDSLTLLEHTAVLVEKPLCGGVAASERVVRAAGEQGRTLHVGYCLRFNEGLVWMKERLPAIGTVRFADAECLSWLPDWRPGADYSRSYSLREGEGGALRDLSHEIDYCCWLFGPVADVTAQLSNTGLLGGTDRVEDTAVMMVRHASGVVVTMRLGFSTRPASRRLRVWGESGVLEWDAVAKRAVLLSTAGEVADACEWQDPRSMYEAQARAWLDVLGGGAPGQLASGEEGARAVAVCAAAGTASERCAWVQP